MKHLRFFVMIFLSFKNQQYFVCDLFLHCWANHKPQTTNHKPQIILFSLLLFLAPDVTFSQECGMESTDHQEVLGFLEYLNNTPVAANAMNTEYEIPVHLTIVNDDNGVSPDPGVDIGNAFVSKINGVNQYFTNGMRFFLCGVSEINSTQYYNLNFNSSGGEAVGLSDSNNLPNVLNIYAVESINNGLVIGVGAFPWNAFYNSSVIVLPTVSSNQLAHEIGHYFGLFHTHQWGIGLKPDNEWNDILYSSVCWCCECADGFPPDDNSEDCFGCGEPCDCNEDNSGDFITDTPVDLGIEHCTGCSGSCSVDVTLPSGGQTVNYSATYSPDYKNIMSYYWNCQEHFSPEQLLRIKQVLLTYTNRNFLIDVNQPICEIFPSKKGKVTKVILESNPTFALTFKPFIFNLVEINDSGANEICSEYTAQTGIYKIENCTLPIGNSDITVAPSPAPLGTAVLDDVSTFDLILMQQHILGTAPFSNPYQYIAADVNNSGTITVLDQIQIKKVILGISSQFPVDSWRYVPKYAFDDASFSSDFQSDPFTAVWNHPNGQQYSYLGGQGTKSYLDALDLNILNTDLFYENTWGFKGIKSGNVNLFEDENLSPSITSFLFENHNAISVNTEFTVNVVASGSQESIYGYQFGALFDDSAVEIVGFDRGDLGTYTPDNFSIESSGIGEIVRAVWYGSGAYGEPAYFPLSVKSEKTLFKIILKAKTKILKLEDIISLSNEAMMPYFFDSLGLSHPVDLKLKLAQGVPPKHLLHSLYPNPVSNQITFEVQSSEVVPITLELQDQFGQVMTISSTTLAGTQGYVFSQFGALQDGVLYYRIEAGNEVMTGYVIKQ